MTALHCARNRDVVAALLAGGANVNAVDVRTVQTACLNLTCVAIACTMPMRVCMANNGDMSTVGWYMQLCIRARRNSNDSDSLLCTVLRCASVSFSRFVMLL